MSQNAVGTFWHGPPLGPFERLCLSSFEHAGYSVTVYSYGPVAGAPETFGIRDAADIVPRETFQAAMDSGAPVAFFADLFRYRLLAARSITWVDADVLLVGTRLPDDEYLFGHEDIQTDCVNNGILAAPPDSPLIYNLVQRTADMDLSAIEWGVSGPLLLTEELRALGLLDRARGADELFPIAPRELPLLFDPGAKAVVRDRVRGAFTVHLWNEVLRRGGAPVKQLRPPTGSWIAEQFSVHGIDFETPLEHDVRWITDAVNPLLQRAELEAAIDHYRRECQALDHALAKKHEEWAAAAHAADQLERARVAQNRRISDLERQIVLCGERIQAADAHIRAIEASRTWRIMRRLRRHD